jgi:hypothetical protein
VRQKARHAPILAMTIGPHLPSTIPRSDEAKRVGGGGIAKNFGVVGWINSVQTAWHYRPALATAVIAIACRRRSGAQNAQGGGDCRRDESHLSTDGGFLLLPHATRMESMALCPRRKRILGPKK